MEKVPITLSDNQRWAISIGLILFGGALFILRAAVGTRFYIGEIAALSMVAGAAFGLLQAERSRKTHGGAPP